MKTKTNNVERKSVEKKSLGKKVAEKNDLSKLKVKGTKKLVEDILRFDEKGLDKETDDNLGGVANILHYNGNHMEEFLSIVEISLGKNHYHQLSERFDKEVNTPIPEIINGFKNEVVKRYNEMTLGR